MGGIIRPPLYLTAKLRNNWELGIRNRVFFAYPAQWGHDPLLYLPLCGRNQTASVLLFSAPLARSGNNSAFLLQVTDFFCNFAAANQKKRGDFKSWATEISSGRFRGFSSFFGTFRYFCAILLIAERSFGY